MTMRLKTPDWETSQWYEGGGRGHSAPLCKHCGQRIRSDESPRPKGPGTTNPPWNAGWDGTCEHCGVRYELVMDLAFHHSIGRAVHVRPANGYQRTCIDAGINPGRDRDFGIHPSIRRRRDEPERLPLDGRSDGLDQRSPRRALGVLQAA